MASGAGSFGFAVLHQFQALHQPQAAHVADQRIFFLQGFELFAEVAADHVGIFQQVFLFDEFDGGAGGDAR